MFIDNYIKIKNSLPTNVTLLVVSKQQSVDKIESLYQIGQKCFGENKVQDLLEKHKKLPDAEWHFIGHLQTNKVKLIAPFISLIHSCDSLKVLKEIDDEAKKNNRIIDCLLEFHISGDDTKFGLTQSHAVDILSSTEYKNMEHINICGVMGMASFIDDTSVISSQFAHLNSLFLDLKKNFFINNSSFNVISMGMSGDYHIAINEGSTLVRIGSSIFVN